MIQFDPPIQRPRRAAVTNVQTLISHGVVPQDHTLTQDDHSAIESLSVEEIQCLVQLKHKLGDDFLKRNTRDAANCFL